MKVILPVFQVFNAQSMTGTTALTSPVSNITYKDNISYEMVWTGTPTGTFAIQGSLDYNPGTPESGGAMANGTWVTVPVYDSSGNAPAASGAAGNVLLDLNEFSFPFIRMVYTNSASTGTLNGWVSGKSVGA